MTAFVVHMARDRVTIASDTLGYSLTAPPRPLGFVLKVIAFPHLRAALYGRGALALLAATGAHLMTRQLVHDLDSAAAELPGILRAVTADYCDEHGIDDPDHLLIFECFLAGWSESRGRAVVVSFVNTRDYAPLWSEPGELGLRAVPPLPPAYLPRDLAGKPLDRQLVGLMTAVRRFFGDHPEVVPAIIGGEVQITDISRSGISSRIVHRFEDFEEARIAGAAVTARIARGEVDVDPASAMQTLAVSLSAEEIMALTPPEPDAPSIAPVGAPPMNRQQRRAAERAARRVA